ncbi:MAG: FAD-dependent oxidoreductase [Alphaproteobacteria bacterium]
MTPRSVVIVGAGQGGAQVAASLREEGYDGAIALVGAEPGLPYQRPPLSKAFLKTPLERDALMLRNAAFFLDQRIDLIAGRRVAAIDRAVRRVTLDDGGSRAFDHLILATGARNRRPPIEGIDAAGVLDLRTVDDAEALRARLDDGGRLLVIGGGFIGLEVAATARQRGLDVVVFEALPRLMARAVSPAMSAHFLDLHRRLGVDVRLGAKVARIRADAGRATAVETADGAIEGGDAVLVAVGVAPCDELAAAAGLTCDNGIVVDRLLQTEDPGVSALGDCAAFDSPWGVGRVRLESVQNAVDHAKCIARRLVGRPEPYAAVPWFWTDQADAKLQIAGLTAGADRTVAQRGDDAGRLSVFCFSGDRFVGVESVNRPADHIAARKALGFECGLTADLAAAEGFSLAAYLKALPQP